MTAKAMKETGILGVLVIVLGIMLYTNLTTSPAAPVPAPSAPPAAVNRKPVTVDASAIDVKLERLTRDSDAYGAAARDPFRFKPKPAPEVKVVQPTVVVAPPVNPGPPPPPPQPRIETLIRYWGYSVSPAGKAIAMLSYGAANSTTAVQVVGVEGDVIEGRYRLQRIEPTAIEVIELSGNRRARIPRL